MIRSEAPRRPGVRVIATPSRSFWELLVAALPTWQEELAERKGPVLHWPRKAGAEPVGVIFDEWPASAPGTRAGTP